MGYTIKSNMPPMGNNKKIDKNKNSRFTAPWTVSTNFKSPGDSAARAHSAQSPA